MNLAKSNFGNATVTYLGHVIGQGNTAPRSAKVEAVLKYSVPQNRKEFRRFLGMAGFYRRFCKNFASVAAPLASLISPKKRYEWSDDAQTSFDNLKALLASAPVLQTVNFLEPFTLQVDACDTGVEAVLLQRKRTTQLLHPICYFSHKFLKHQKNNSTIEKECLGLVLALDKFSFYLMDSPHPIETNTDHNPLAFIHHMRNHNQRLIRWALLIQPFDLKITHIAGKENVIPDSLSRVHST